MKGCKKALSVLLACTMIFMTACSAEDIERVGKMLSSTDDGKGINININSDELPTTDYVGRGFCYAARRHEPAGIVYPAEQGMSTMPLSHRVTFGNTFLKMFAAPLMSALVTVPS